MNTEPINPDDSILEDAETQQAVDDLLQSINDSQAAEPESAGEKVDEVTSLRMQLSEMEKTALRHQADLENFRKRSRNQMQEQLKYASLPIISELLDSVDNLNRATEMAEGETDSTGIVEGVKMVAQQLSSLLEQQGCKQIESVGQPFDPNRHQAVQQQPSEEFPANTVMIEVRPGFMLHERVIRPAQVFVSTGPAK